jgi:hypothetical protein
VKLGRWRSGFSGYRSILTLIYRVVDEVVVAQPTDKPRWPNPGRSALKEPHMELDLAGLRRKH